MTETPLARAAWAENAASVAMAIVDEYETGGGRPSIIERQELTGTIVALCAEIATLAADVRALSAVVAELEKELTIMGWAETPPEDRAEIGRWIESVRKRRAKEGQQ